MLDQYLPGALTGGSVTALIYFIIAWVRGRKKDSADVRNRDASSTKLLSESYQIKVNAELQIAGEWKRITEALRLQLKEERDDCDKEIADLRTYYNKKIDRMTEEMNTMKFEIETLKKMNADKT